MTILSGSLNLRCFKINLNDINRNNLNQYLIEKLNNQGYNVRDIEDEKKIGWVTLENRFTSTFTSEKTVFEKFLIFAIRIQFLSISPKEKDYAEQEIRADTNGQITEEELQEELEKRIRRLQEAKLEIPNPEIYDVVLSIEDELCLFISSSKNVEIFENLFRETFPSIQLTRFSPSIFVPSTNKQFQNLRETSLLLYPEEIDRVIKRIKKEKETNEEEI